VIDTRRADQLARVPHVDTLDAALRSLWIDGASVAWKPRSIDDVDAACRAVAAGKRVLVLIDESHRWLSASSGCSAELVSLMRANQHERTHLFLATQHFSGDIPQSALGCAPDVYVFRTTSWRARKILRDEFNIDPTSAATLPKYHYLQHSSGF
jgi:hypothetical protein